MTLIIRQSRIHSYGCYTTRPIRKGTLIVEYVGEYLTCEQADDLYDDFENTYLFGLDGGKKHHRRLRRGRFRQSFLPAELRDRSDPRQDVDHRAARY